jgi:hypothetical protein
VVRDRGPVEVKVAAVVVAEAVVLVRDLVETVFVLHVDLKWLTNRVCSVFKRDVPNVVQ